MGVCLAFCYCFASSNSSSSCNHGFLFQGGFTSRRAFCWETYGSLS
ncbi:hypothetical protein LINPERPRIM_LOCUS7664 [Linum perenne]